MELTIKKEIAYWFLHYNDVAMVDNESPFLDLLAFSSKGAAKYWVRDNIPTKQNCLDYLAETERLTALANETETITLED